MAPSDDGRCPPLGDTVDVCVATSPCDFAAVPRLLAEISQLGDGLKADDRLGRLALLARAKSLVNALETPCETMIKHVGAQTAAMCCLALGVESGLFKLMALDSAGPKTVDKLAAAMGYEADVLRRVLRHLAAMGYVSELGPDEYRSTNFTKALALPIVGDGYPMYAHSSSEPIKNLQKWLALNNYRAPRDPKNNPRTLVQPEASYFEHLANNPPRAAQFNNHMGGARLGRPSWMDPSIYPVAENLLRDFRHDDDAQSVLLVDIGGGYGHDAAEFHAKFPLAPGRIVVQDRAPVLAAIPRRNPAIEYMEHDFFTTQPVHGARAYYMHQIMHDWPDERCVEIVERVKPAMTPEYSKLLINEQILPPVGAGWEATYLDIYMMTLFSARERTEDEWRHLLERRCGLRICAIWNRESGVEGIVECELASGA